MKRLILTLLSLFIFSTAFFISPSLSYAISWPPEVKPERGKASGIFDVWDSKNIINIEFWNVGEVGGSEYGEITFETKCTEKTTTNGWTCVDDDRPINRGIFAGGPNGKVTFEGEANEVNLHLVNGKYFEMTLGKTFQIPVENPEIFSKYRWSLDESIPVPVIKEGKYEVETAGSARFNGLSGQVEVNIPQKDGTYDDEAWSFAKLGMDLPPGTHLKISEKSEALLTFPDMQTNITVGPDTEIVLVSTAPQKEAIQLLWGNLKANVKKMLKDGSMEVEMSQAVAGIKGTQFVLNETKTESSIKVIEGTVKFTSKSTGASIDVSKGESVLATSKGLLEKTTFNPVEEERKWQELANNLKMKNVNIIGNNIVYILGGIIGVVILGFLILRTKRLNHK